MSTQIKESRVIRSLRILTLAVGLGTMALSPAHAALAQGPPASAVEQDIPAADRIEVPQLAQSLSAAEKPLILQVGPHTFYDQAHIASAEFVGPTGTPAGLDALRKRVSGLKKSQWIVIYCGCCPWGRCPNIRPAFQELQNLGFTHVQALYIPNNFGADWVNKGYPTTK